MARLWARARFGRLGWEANSVPPSPRAIRRVAFGLRCLLLLGVTAVVVGAAVYLDPDAWGLGLPVFLCLVYTHLAADAECDRLELNPAKIAGRTSRRYAATIAPAGTRCAFCRCDFFAQEVASQCIGCRSLVHAECASDLLATPGPACPTYGCEGQPETPDPL